MSNAYQQAADALRREATRLKGLAEAADAMDKLGSIEQAAAESERRLKTAREESDALDDKIARSRSVLAEVEANAKSKVQGADDLAATILDRANKAADNVIESAEFIADATVADAEAAAKHLRDAGNEEYLAAIRKVTEAEKDRYQINEQAEAAHNELAVVNARLEAARAQMRKLLEG